MNGSSNITAAIIESLYDEALCLAELTRDGFERFRDVQPEDGPAQAALSREALRSTTRMMHALAWLLNHRAYFAGDLSAYQLQRHGRLPPPQPLGDACELALLPPEVLTLRETTSSFYARLMRVDKACSLSALEAPTPVNAWREQIGAAFASAG